MTYTAEDVQNILSTFVSEFAVDIPAKHIDGDYLIPLGELEYALEYPESEWLESIAGAANARV